MVLMHFTVDGGGGLFVTVLGNVFLDNGWSNLLMDSGVMVTSFVPVQEYVSKFFGEVKTVEHENTRQTPTPDH